MSCQAALLQINKLSLNGLINRRKNPYTRTFRATVLDSLGVLQPALRALRFQEEHAAVRAQQLVQKWVMQLWQWGKVRTL